MYGFQIALELITVKTQRITVNSILGLDNGFSKNKMKNEKANGSLQLKCDQKTR